MSLRAAGHRHLAVLWRSKRVPWRWWALQDGWAQPQRFVWHDRRRWRFHLTPIHLERWDSFTEVGVCWGWRTVIVLVHR